MSTSTQHFADPGQVHERRMHPRIVPKSLIYVACGEANGGMVLNASDDGLAISMAIAVGDDSFSNLHVRMNGLSQSIEVHGRTVWTTRSKKRAGIQLVDVTDSQREQIREWIALEGVRDVNLLPRTVGDAVPGPPVVAGGAISPMVFAEPRYSLLDAFGGSAPESLGPVNQGIFSSEGMSGEPQPSQGFDSLNPSGFRESEWDLAAVTLIPRKKTRPEGLPAFALMLLWIAIPSFAIGILVGRRPLEQWLSQKGANGKGISQVVTRVLESVKRGDQPPMADIAGTPQPSAPSDSEGLSAANSLVSNSDVSSAPVVDAKLLNSMSSQEARALLSSNAADAAKKLNPPASSNFDAIAHPVWEDPIASKKAKPEPVLAPSIAASPADKREIPSGLAAHDVASKTLELTVPPVTAHNDEKSIGLTLPEQISSERVPKTISVDTGLDSAGAKNTAILSTQAASSVSTRAAGIPPSTVSAPSGTKAGQVTSKPPASLSVSNPALASPAAAPRAVVPNTAPSLPPARTLAPVTAQPPLHGVLLVARKNDESFLLRLPVESVAGRDDAAVHMQRFVMVPPQSRWHRRGPIAKLTIGELLTQVAPDKPDAGITPRAGDVVTVRAFVGKDGSVLDLKPVSGRFAMMPRVMRAVRDWQFDQTLLDGKPVESEVNVTVEFRSAH